LSATIFFLVQYADTAILGISYAFLFSFAYHQSEIPLEQAAFYKNVYFLGFGYDQSNMKIINPTRFTSASLHGTAYNFTSEEISKIKTGYNIDAANSNCRDYIKKIFFS
jgi:hypothetical protein